MAAPTRLGEDDDDLATGEPEEPMPVSLLMAVVLALCVLAAALLVVAGWR